MNTQYIAVITGDIVNSRTEMPSVWINALKDALNQFGKSPLQWEIFRGDMFQLMVPINKALISAITIKATIKQINGLDVRLAIGLGQQTYSSTNITESNGSAFVNSGHCFEHLKRKKIAIKSPWADFDKYWNLYLKLSAMTMNYWSPKSAETFLVALNNPNSNQVELSKKLNITQSTVSENLKRSGYYQINDMIQWFEANLTDKISDL